MTRAMSTARGVGTLAALVALTMPHLANSLPTPNLPQLNNNNEPPLDGRDSNHRDLALVVNPDADTLLEGRRLSRRKKNFRKKMKNKYKPHKRDGDPPPTHTPSFYPRAAPAHTLEPSPLPQTTMMVGRPACDPPTRITHAHHKSPPLP